MPHRALALLLLLLLAAVHGCDAALEKVFVLHRHGARTAMGVLPSGKLSCNEPHCRLTDFGKAQCVAVGQALAQRYRAQLGLTDYNVTKMHSVSTAIDRVVLSGESVVLGMYPDALPFVDYVRVTDDVQMSWWNSWPAYKMSDAYNRAVRDVELTAAGLFNSSVLTRFGVMFGLEAMCASSPADCASFVSDAVASNLTSGLAVEPWILALRPQLQRVTASFMAALIGYDPSDSYKRSVGSYGYPLTSAMMRMFADARSPSGFEYNFFHRAAHDWTLFSAYSSLGLWTPADTGADWTVVRFAETLIVELHSDGTATRRLKAFKAVPSQGYSADYSYSVPINEVGIKCTAANGTVTYSNGTSAGCDMDSVWRTINASAPASGDGICYATHAWKKDRDCLGNGAPAADSACAFYRERCVNAGCGSLPKAVADPAQGFACVSLDAAPQSTMALASVLAVVLSTITVGSVIGYLAGGKFEAALRGWCGKSES